VFLAPNRRASTCSAAPPVWPKACRIPDPPHRNNAAIELADRHELVALEAAIARAGSLAEQPRAASRNRQHRTRVFVMTGAIPNTRWLDGCVAPRQERFHQRPDPISPGTSWRPAALAPGAPADLLETKPAGRPSRSATPRGGKHQIGGVRVGEGSIAVSFVHQVLQE